MALFNVIRLRHFVNELLTNVDAMCPPNISQCRSTISWKCSARNERDVLPDNNAITGGSGKGFYLDARQFRMKLIKVICKKMGISNKSIEHDEEL
jgi:hypothetical protein